MQAMTECFGPDKADVICDCAGNDITMGQSLIFAFKDYLQAYQQIDENRETTMKVLIDVQA